MRDIVMKDSQRSSRRQLLRMGAALGGGLLAKHEGALAGENTPGQLGIPLGPYGEQGDRPRVLSSVPGKVRGPGHHSIVTGPDGKTQYIVYHAWDPTMTVRWMCVDKLVWTPQGPRCEGPTSSPQAAPGTGME